MTHKLFSNDMLKEHPAIMAKANCLDCPPEWFFPVIPKGRMGPGPRDALRKAKQTCNECPVQEKCYDFAVKHRCLGVWGGHLFSFNKNAKIKLSKL